MQSTEQQEAAHDESAESEGSAIGGAATSPIQVTPKAVRMIELTREEEGLDPTWGLRVAVRGGGCSGFEYALDFDEAGRENDYVLTFGDLTVYLDAVSARYLEGTTIDYVMGAKGSGFKFDNPKASGTCGCGSSFAL